MAFVAAIGLWRGGEADSREHGSALASGSDPQIGQECLVFGGIWAGVLPIKLGTANHNRQYLAPFDKLI